MTNSTALFKRATPATDGSMAHRWGKTKFTKAQMFAYVLQEAPHSTLQDMATALGISREYVRLLCKWSGAKCLTNLTQAAAELRRLKLLLLLAKEMAKLASLHRLKTAADLREQLAAGECREDAKGLDMRRLCDDMTEAMANQLHYLEHIEHANSLNTAAEVNALIGGGIERYRNNPIFRAKVTSTVARILDILAARQSSKAGEGREG